MRRDLEVQSSILSNALCTTYVLTRATFYVPGELTKEVFPRSVEKEKDSDMRLDDDGLFRLTPPTMFSPLANP